MAYYGFEHRYGANMRECGGRLVGTLYVFVTRRSRDAWVGLGNAYTNKPGARTVIRSTSAARFARACAAIEHVNT